MVIGLVFSILATAPEPFWGAEVVTDGEKKVIINCSRGACTRGGVPIKRAVVLSATARRMVVGLEVDLRAVQVIELERTSERVVEVSCHDAPPLSLFRIGSGGYHREVDGRWEYLDSCRWSYIDLFFDDTAMRREARPGHQPERYGMFGDGRSFPSEPTAKIDALVKREIDRGSECKTIASSDVYKLRDGVLYQFYHFCDLDSVSDRPLPMAAGKIRLSYAFSPSGELLPGSGCGDELPAEGSDVYNLRRLPTSVELESGRLEFLDLCRSGVRHQTYVTFLLREGRLTRLSERRVNSKN